MHGSLCLRLFSVACLPFSTRNSQYQFADKEFLASAFFSLRPGAPVISTRYLR